jgi:16S rRNA (adenine1518-N6/adenine1519-N6)-dimethyltransferase
MRAKKSLGQHFLRSDAALDKIVEAGEIVSGETVLEIGPGHGALTEKLLATNCRLVAIEKDDALYELLQTKFHKYIESGDLVLVHGDVLSFNIGEYLASNLTYKIVANIPYNITGGILRKFLSHEKQPEKMVLLVQKEVAERIIGGRGSRASTKESILSLSVKAYGKPRYVGTVKAGSFVPAPKVDSAILAIEGISNQFFEQFSENEYFKLLHAGFSAKRKKLSSNLSQIYPKDKVLDVFSTLNLDPNIRAEDLNLEIWRELSSLLIEQN